MTQPAFGIRARTAEAICRFLAAANSGRIHVVSKSVRDSLPPMTLRALLLVMGAAAHLRRRVAGRSHGLRAISFVCASRLT